MVLYLGNRFLGDSDRASRMYISHKMEPLGLDGRSEFVFFCCIARMPGITSTNIAKITLFDKGMVAKAVRALEEKGLVLRKSDEQDRRSSHLYLTPRGEEVYRQAVQILQDWNKRIYDALPWPNEEIEQMLRAIATASRKLLAEELHLDLSKEDQLLRNLDLRDQLANP